MEPSLPIKDRKSRYLLSAALLLLLSILASFPACKQRDQDSPLLPPEKRTESGRHRIELIVKAQDKGSGIYVTESSIFKTGMISYYTLGLPPELAKRLKEWIKLYRSRLLAVDFDYHRFNDTGRRLAADLRKYLGSECHVEYKPVKNY